MAGALFGDGVWVLEDCRAYLVVPELRHPVGTTQWPSGGKSLGPSALR